MTRPVRTSLSISFSSNLSREVLQLEVDGRVEGGNRGRTQFYPGDSVHLLEFRTNRVSVVDRFATDGGLVALGTGSIEITEFVTVSGAKIGNTTRPISSGFSLLRYWGRPVTISGYDGSTINLQSETVAVLEVRYTTQFTVLRLSGASGEAPVIVYVMGIAG